MSLHSWDVTYEEARQIQSRLRRQLRFPLKKADFRWVAGADVSYDQRGGRVVAAVVVLDALDGKVDTEAHAVLGSRFPYIPGLLSFREAPAVLAAWKNLSRKPQALLLDGQGMAHPRRFGLACHVGMWLDIPTVGCAKSRLLGEYEEPGPGKGCWSELSDGEEVVGAVVRSRARVRPIFVSQGYLLPLPLCIRLVIDWCRGYRVPEPTRQAHIRVTAIRKRLAQA